MRHIYFLSLVLFALSTSLLGQTLAINSLSSMPSDTTTILMNYDPSIWPPSTGLLPLLQSQGIQIESYPTQIGWTVANGFFAPDPSSPSAPFGDLEFFNAVRFTFPNPVYAFGGTFFATPI